ncbi:hypothetical protein, partial [Leptospira noguchii]
RFLRKRLKLNTTLTTDRVVGREPVHYEICELRRRPIGSRCIEFIIRPNFLTSNSRFLKDSLIPK